VIQKQTKEKEKQLPLELHDSLDILGTSNDTTSRHGDVWCDVGLIVTSPDDTSSV